jgi:hypothetical protein
MGLSGIGLAAVAVAAVLSPGACYHGTNDVPLADGGGGASTGGQGGAGTTSASAGQGGAGPATSGSGGQDGGAGNGGAGTGGASPMGVFVAVGYGGRRLRSTDDGMTWSGDVALEPDGGGDDNDLLRTVVWGPSGFVALGWRSMTSPDGNNWTDHGANIGQWLGGAVYAGGQFVAVGGYGMRAVSPDGVTWTNHSIDTIATHAGDGIIYGDVMGGRFASANDNGQRSYSTDAVTWTYSTGVTATLTTHLAFGGGIFLGVGGTAVVTSSDGGATWVAATALPVAGDGLVFAAGQFTAVASGHVYTSTNGATWADHPVTGLQGGPLAYGDGTYVMVNGGGALQRSTDGVTWAAPVESGINALQWVTFGMVP